MHSKITLIWVEIFCAISDGLFEIKSAVGKLASSRTLVEDWSIGCGREDGKM